MNKQEAIEKIRSEKILGGINSYGLGFNEALDEAIYIVKQLDEPEKPEKVVVSKLEAEWLDKLKEHFSSRENQLFIITRRGWGKGFEFKHEGVLYEIPFDEYMERGGASAVGQRLVNAILYGYEVEKKKLYTARHQLIDGYLTLEGGEWCHYSWKKQGSEHPQSVWEECGVWDSQVYEIEEAEE